MNRSILIVICDFLLLSLLTFSTDINHMADENTPPPTKVVITKNPVANPGNDLNAVLKQALEEERRSQQQLQAQLARARNAAGQQQAQLSRRELQNQQLQQKFAAAQTNIQKLTRQLQSNSAQAQQQLAATEAAAQTNIQKLTRQLQSNSAQSQQQLAAVKATAQTNIQNLTRQLQSNSAQAQQQLAAVKAAAQRQSDLAAALRRQLAQLERTNRLAQAEKQQLSNRLQLVEVQARAATERATLMQQQVQVQQAENTRLAESFKTLATNSTRLTQEIRKNRPLAPNTIFSEFVSNHVRVAITAWRTSLFTMDTSRDTKTESVLVTDGTNIFALCHVQETPLKLGDPGTDWDQFKGTLARRSAQVPILSLSFDARDPRVVMMPVTPAEARELGCKIYRLSSDPYQFQDAILIGADAGYYGECSFQIEPNTPRYVKLDRSLLKGLFGKFNPSRGDLVFSRTGELLGIMVNNTYCLTLHHFAAAATFPFNQLLTNRHTGGTLSGLYAYVYQLPARLR